MSRLDNWRTDQVTRTRPPFRYERRGARVKRCRELIGTLRFVKLQVVNDVSRRVTRHSTPGAITLRDSQVDKNYLGTRIPREIVIETTYGYIC